MSVRTFMIDESFIASVIAVYFFGTGFPVDNGRTASCAKPASTDRTIYHATEKINPARRSTLNICVLYFLQIVPFRFCQVSRTVWNPAIGSFVKFTRQQCSHIRPCKIRIIIFLDLGEDRYLQLCKCLALVMACDHVLSKNKIRSEVNIILVLRHLHRYQRNFLNSFQ